MRANPLLSRQFLPLFTVQALNAFNDNLFKNALVVLIAFRAAEGSASLVALAGGIFLLPFLLLSATAGQLADKVGKTRLVVWTQIGAALLMVAALVALAGGHVPTLLAVLFGLGVHAALFGPLKYGALPELLPPAALLRANALVETGTFAAILLGTVAGGLAIGTGEGTLVVGAAGVAVALAGLGAAAAMPVLPPAAPALRLNPNILAETRDLLRLARANRPVWISILGLSWFWALGATFLAQFPILAQAEFGADNRVVTLLLTAFALGVGLGSMAAGRVRGGTATVPRAALVLSVATVGFALLCARPAARAWSSPQALLTSADGLAALACLLVAAAAGGLYSVPLYALLQRAADPAARARMVGANNVVNAVFIVASAAALAVAAALGCRPPTILAGTAALNAVAAVLLWRGLRGRVAA